MAYFYSTQSLAYQLGLYVTTSSQNIEDNTTTIYWRLDLLKHSSAYSIAGMSATFAVDINGVRRLEESIYFSMSAGQTSIGIRDGYVTIPHNSDGTKSFSSAFFFVPSISGSYIPAYMEGSGTYTCATIARATTPTLSKSSAELGTAVTITATPAVSTFTHKLYYQIGSADKVSITTLSAGTQSYAWTVSEGIADSFPSATSGSISIVCETYSGSTLIGTKSVDLTVTMPSTMVPTISNVAIAEATANIASKFGAYVQGKSTLKITTTAAGVRGSTIDSIAVEVGGTAYSGSPVTTGVLNTSGNVAVKVTVTDSRGRTATTTKTISVTAYSAPSITVADAVRSLADGTVNEEGTRIKFTYKFNVAPVGNKNDKTFKIQYLNGSTWTDLYTVSAYTGNSSYVSTVTFSIDNAYDVRFVLTDYFSTTTIQKQVAPSFVLMDFGAGGKSMAIGQRSSNNGRLECDLPATFNNGAVLTDTIRPTDANMVANADKRSTVEHYLASGSMTSNKPAHDGHIVHLHWDNEGGWDSQLFIPDNTSSDEYARTLAYRSQNGGTWGTWRNAALNSYPIGSTYESTSNTDPATLFGGTWSQIQTHETLTVTGSKVVSVSSGRAQMHTKSQIQALFNEKYGFTPTFSATVTSAQASADNATAGDAYLDLGAVYTNGDLNANGALVGMGRGTDSNDVYYVLSTANGGLRVNYTYITHRTMYKWTRTA